MRTNPEEQKNIRDFFDGFLRLEQKSRLKGEFPKENDLVRLAILKNHYKDVFGKVDNKKVEMVKTTIDTIVKKKLEYSISIGGAGREEFIKTRTRPKEDIEEEQKEGDFIGKIAEKIG